MCGCVLAGKGGCATAGLLWGVGVMAEEQSCCCRRRRSKERRCAANELQCCCTNASRIVLGNAEEINYSVPSCVCESRTNRHRAVRSAEHLIITDRIHRNPVTAGFTGWSFQVSAVKRQPEGLAELGRRLGPTRRRRLPAWPVQPCSPARASPPPPPVPPLPPPPHSTGLTPSASDAAATAPLPRGVPARHRRGQRPVMEPELTNISTRNTGRGPSVSPMISSHAHLAGGGPAPPAVRAAHPPAPAPPLARQQRHGSRWPLQHRRRLLRRRIRWRQGRHCRGSGIGGRMSGTGPTGSRAAGPDRPGSGPDRRLRAGRASAAAASVPTRTPVAAAARSIGARHVCSSSGGASGGGGRSGRLRWGVESRAARQTAKAARRVARDENLQVVQLQERSS